MDKDSAREVYEVLRGGGDPNGKIDTLRSKCLEVLGESAKPAPEPEPTPPPRTPPADFDFDIEAQEA